MKQAQTQDVNNGTETNDTIPPKRGKKRKIVIKLLISIAILSLILYKLVDRKALLEKLERVSPGGLVAVIAVYVLGQIISSYKWRVFIAQVGINRTPLETMRAYFLGMFVNTFGLGTVGGDVARGLLLNPEKGKRTAALATVVADRIHGLGVLLSIGSIAAIFWRPAVDIGWIFPLGVITIPLMLIAWAYGPKILIRVFPADHRWGTAAINATKAFPTQAKPFLTATLLSAVFHISQIYIHVLILKDLQTHIPFGYLLATVPFVNIACSLPVSMNGIGVREALYIFFFSGLGVSNDLAVAIGLIWVITITIISALSGLFFGVVYNFLKRD